MNTLLIIILSLAWYAIGVASFVYWWTRDYPLKTNDIPLAVGAGLIGPLAFLAGWSIHGESGSTSIIRGRK